MKKLIYCLIITIFYSCSQQVSQHGFKYIPPKQQQQITIFTIRDGAFEEPSTWNLNAIPEYYDVCDVNNAITVSSVRVVSGLKSTRGGKITCLPGGSLTVSPKK